MPSAAADRQDSHKGRSPNPYPNQAGLGAEHFCGDMWCSSRDQITLSHYIKTLEVAPDLDTAERATVIQAAYRGKQSRRHAPG